MVSPKSHLSTFTSNGFSSSSKLVNSDDESFKTCYSTSPLLTSCPGLEVKPTPQEYLWAEALRLLEDETLWDTDDLTPSEREARRKELLLDNLDSVIHAYRASRNVELEIRACQNVDLEMMDLDSDYESDFEDVDGEQNSKSQLEDYYY